VYESRSHSVIITLGRQLYRIPEVALLTAISLIFIKKCSKVISQTGKFIFFVICAHNKQNFVSTFVASTQILSVQYNQVYRIMEEYRDIFSSPIGVPTHYQFKHPIDLTPGAPLPNGPVYRRLWIENDKTRHQIQELLQKGHIIPSSSPCGSPTVLV
jgi:hypothetical protein